MNYTEDDYPEIEGLRKEVVRRRIRKLKMRLKFCTPQTCQKCAKMIVKDYNTPKKVLKDPNKSNTQKYFRHSNVKRYELALLRSGYFFYFGRLFILKNFLRCKICCSVYTHPLVLHCAHTFCLQCIAKSCKYVM